MGERKRRKNPLPQGRGLEEKILSLRGNEKKKLSLRRKEKKRSSPLGGRKTKNPLPFGEREG